MAGKQAKVLNDEQQDKMLRFLSRTRYPSRNKLIFLLSIKAGLRAMEIAYLNWRHVINSQGGLSDYITIEDSGSKGKRGGRSIPMHSQIKEELEIYASQMGDIVHSNRIIISERKTTGVNPGYVTTMLWLWYRDVGFIGASSHSGRRTFITNAARCITDCGGSIRDVQHLAGHKSLNTTQRYIDGNEEAKRRLIKML
jgi:integrase/recombinase XerD